MVYENYDRIQIKSFLQNEKIRNITDGQTKGLSTQSDIMMVEPPHLSKKGVNVLKKNY
jgi:hypothetical protein